MVGEQNGLRLGVYCDAGLSVAATAATHLPGGHPEGYLESFANIYRDFARVLRGEPGWLVPGIAEGLRGMALIDRAEAGFWNGTIPLFGYVAEVAEMRGPKAKKRLAIEPSEALQVQQIYRMKRVGIGQGPMATRGSSVI